MFVPRTWRSSERALVCMKEVKITLRITKEMKARLDKWAYKSGFTKAHLIRVSLNHCLNLKGY